MIKLVAGSHAAVLRKRLLDSQNESLLALVKAPDLELVSSPRPTEKIYSVLIIVDDLGSLPTDDIECPERIVFPNGCLALYRTDFASEGVDAHADSPYIGAQNLCHLVHKLWGESSGPWLAFTTSS